MTHKNWILGRSSASSNIFCNRSIGLAIFFFGRFPRDSKNSMVVLGGFRMSKPNPEA